MPAEHDAPLPLEQRRPDHQVGDAGLVFERDELTPFGDPGLCRTRTRPAASDSGSRLNRGRHGCGKVGLPEQFSLFADRLSGPEGPRYAEEFVSPSAEKTLIGHIAALPLQPFQFGQYEGKRRVASFGFRYDTPCANSRRPIRSPGGWARSSRRSKLSAVRAPELVRSFAPSTTSVSSAGTETSRTSTGCSACRGARGASSGFAGPPTPSGSVSGSRLGRIRST
jgi:hypothetical protein